MASFNTDIFVNIGANIAEFNAKINKAMSKLQSFRQMGGAFSQNLAGSATGDFLDTSDLQKQEATVSRLQEQFGRMGGRAKTVTNNVTNIGDALQDSLGRRSGFNQARTQGLLFADAMVDAQTRASEFTDTAKKASGAGSSMADSFDAAALGVMFFGMQLQRIFGGIIRSSVKTFNKVMGQIEGTTTAADRLSGAFKFFKFEVGQAMQPLLGTLTPIIAKVGELADRFPGVTRKVLTFGAAFGGLLMAGGSLRLAQTSIGELLSRMGGLGPAANKALKGLKDFKGGVKNLKNLNFSELTSKLKNLKGPLKTLGGLAGITVGISLGAEAIKDALEGNFGEAIVNGLGAAASSIGGLMLLAGGGGPAAALVGIGVAIQLIGAENIVDAITKTFHVIVSVAKAAAMAIKDNFKEGMINGFKESFNEILDFLAKIGNTVLQAVGMGIDQETMDRAEEAFDKIHGVDDEAKTLTDRFKSNLESFKERNPDLYPEYHESKPDAANVNTAQIIGDTLQTPPFQAQGTNEVDLPQGVKDDISTIADENMRMRKRTEYLNRILTNKEGAFRQAKKYRNMTLAELRQVARGIQETR